MLPRMSGAMALGLSLSLAIACAASRGPAPAAEGPGRVSGALMTMEEEASRLELSDRGQRFSVFYDTQTMIRSGSAALTIDDLRVGDRMVISLGEGATARLVSLAGPQRTPGDSIAPAKESATP